MSYLLEILGRGLIAHLAGAFQAVLDTDNDETTEELIQAAEVQPDNAGAQIRLAARFLHCDDPISARRIFLNLLSRNESHLVARLGLACAYDELGQIESALQQLRIAQKQDAISPAILFCLGYCHERLGHQDDATNYYQDAIVVCPTLRNAHERLAAIFLQQGEIDIAIHHYTELCRLDPQQTEVHLMLANLFLKAGDYEAAIKQYEHALSLEPENWAAHNDLVSSYEKAGLYREAIEHLHQMIEKQPDFADSRLRLGDLYSRVGNDAAATAQYQRALQICPDHLEANVKLGTAYLRTGQYQNAACSFSFALEINDRLLSAYVGIGVAQHASGREDEAMASFEMARNIEPNSTLLFSEVARMQLKAAAGEQANKFLPAAVEDIVHDVDLPGDASEHRAARRVTDLLSQQIERLRQAIQQDPNHADLRYRLGLIYRNRGQIEDAITEFREAVAINPSYMKALIKLGLALYENDQTDEAVDVLKRATELHPDYADLHYHLGVLFAQQHQFEIAVEHLERAVEGNPRNLSFQANLALALQNMGLIDRANATWQIVRELEPVSAHAQQARSEMARNRELP
ncbi:MAG: tetratricopeptide repeat protein [Phycisphaerae bacterium]|nr:tetratricopeptide repeat protein [Phycisphaerae bacterium]